MIVNRVCIGCEVTIYGFDTLVELILLDILNLDLILGMDWMALHHVILNYFSKSITLVILGISQVVWKGSMSHVSTSIISYM